jgi:hypothetical protein
MKDWKFCKNNNPHVLAYPVLKIFVRQKIPGPKSTITSYNPIVVKIYNATNSIARFLNEKDLSLLKMKSPIICSWAMYRFGNSGGSGLTRAFYYIILKAWARGSGLSPTFSFMYLVKPKPKVSQTYLVIFLSPKKPEPEVWSLSPTQARKSQARPTSICQ